MDNFTETFLVALTIWREASSEPFAAKEAVASVIRNRVQRPSWWGKDWVDVVTKPCQFTSMVPPKGLYDPNLIRWPRPDSQSWQDCLLLAKNAINADMADPTNGATFYFDKSLDANPPAWAKQYVHTADIGNFHFYKET